MDHVKILKQAWHTLWRYRALWVFGLILALTTFSWETAVLGDRDGDGDGPPGGPPITYTLPDGSSIEIPRGITLDELREQGVPPEVTSALVVLAVGLACVAVFLLFAAPVARYVSEVALIRMVDEHEQTGAQHTWRQGFRLGWSRTAWRLFLIDLAIDLPAVVAFILLILLAAFPVFGGHVGVVGIVATIGFLFLAIFLIIIAIAALSLLKHFFRRMCALEGLGVTDSIRQGYALVRRHLRDVGLMWLIMVGVSLGWPIIAIPVGLLMAGVGLLAGGTLGLLVRGLAGLALEETASWIVAGAVGIPAFILVLVVPLVFLGGLRETFQSSTWTLTFRELRALESMELEQVSERDTGS